MQTSLKKLVVQNAEEVVGHKSASNLMRCDEGTLAKDKNNDYPGVEFGDLNKIYLGRCTRYVPRYPGAINKQTLFSELTAVPKGTQGVFGSVLI